MSKPTGIRLQKFIASAGICSRRAAEELIVNGEVTVNGQPAELGQRVQPDEDRVVVRGRRVKPSTAAPMTVALNKPRNYLCSHHDPHHNRTIYELLPREFGHRRFVCAGRLDLDSEGLVILTTDGDLANRLMHPSSQVMKRYRVTLNRPFPLEKTPNLLKGVEFEGEFYKAEKAIPLKSGRAEATTDWEIHLDHGKKREIRRLFEAFGFYVKRLRRFQIGGLTVRRIPVGKCRILTARDLQLLFQNEAESDEKAFF
ncbi:MAG TPA: pseudouridine synthase [Opitutales bacterium]|nr:pseudouridine synthase [Opitutales bacterium]